MFKREQKTFVLGIDGVPYSFLQDNFKRNKMKNLARISMNNGGKRINSVYPTISSVAWTTFATGKNSGGHNVFGFIERTPNPFEIKIPTARDRKAGTIWNELSQLGKKVIVINVPLTYPPERMNGILVSGFLCPDIEKGCFPQNFSDYLKSRGYIIDVDASLARKSKKEFMKRLHQAMEKRFEIAFELMEKEKWDFFQLHIMETDRLFHFFWNDVQNKGEYSEEIEIFFEKLDSFIGNLEEKLSSNARLLILSDHGFCGIKKEVQLNTWLEQEGLLKFESGREKEISNYDKDSICYSLIPGRIFINLDGREEKGSVKENEYEKIRQDVKEKLLNFKNPENNEKIIERVFFREEIYDGEYLKNAADIIAHPVRGYDLKGRVGIPAIFNSSALQGMHTYDDAFICANCNLDHVHCLQDVKNILMSANSSNYRNYRF